MSDTLDSGSIPRGWPRPEPHQVQVMLLGTYHMDNPGLDENNLEADDVLAPKRQAELRDLVERLARWEPERVAVERPYDRNEDVNSFYEEFRSGTLAYDERDVDADYDFGVFPAETDGEVRSEVVQIGFRLADRLDHERVYPIDCPTDLHNDELEALENSGFQPEEKVAFSLPDGEAIVREDERLLAASTIPGFLARKNQAEQLRINHDGMFARGLRWGEGDNFGGPRMLARWYERNLRMAHNLWRAIEPGDERMLLIVGSGHVSVLRHLLDEAPMFCPTSPLAYLS